MPGLPAPDPSTVADAEVAQRPRQWPASVLQRKAQLDAGETVVAEEVVFMRLHCDNMARQGLLTRNPGSPFRAPAFAARDEHGQLGLYIDYSELAKITIRPPEYPMASEQDLEAMKAKYPNGGCYSELAVRTYPCAYPVRIAIGDEPKTAFGLPDGTTYQWNVLPFDLPYSEIGMQRDLDHTLKDIPDCVSRIDRIVLASPDPGSHTQHLEKVLQACKANNMYLELPNCKFGLACTPAPSS